MNDVEYDQVHDDFDDFDDISPNNNQTNKKSDLDDLESIKSEENLSPKAKPKNNKGKNDYLNSFNKSLNDSSLKPEKMALKPNKPVNPPMLPDENLEDSFEDNFVEVSLDDKKLTTIKRSEINDDSFLEKEKQTLQPEQLKKAQNSKNKENTKPSTINIKLAQKPVKNSNFKKNEAKSIQPALVPSKNVAKKRHSTKSVALDIRKTNIKQSEVSIHESKAPVYKVRQLKPKPKPAPKFEGFSLIAVVEENKQLFEDLKCVNDKLTTLIEEKGYQNQLDKIRENNTEFKYRPVNVKITTNDKEVKNNEKIIEVLSRELNLYRDTVKKLDSTELLNDITKCISNYNAKIKAAKSNIYQIQLDHKKNEGILKNKDLEDKKAFNFKNLMVELDSYMTKNTELYVKISKLQTLKQELLEDYEIIQKENSNVKKLLEEKNLNNFDENIIQKHKNLLSIKKRWESHLIRHQKNIELKVLFAEKDTEQYNKEISELQDKIDMYDRSLNKQAASLREIGHEPHVEVHNFEIKKKNHVRKPSAVTKKDESKIRSVDKKYIENSERRVNVKVTKLRSRNTSVKNEKKIQISVKTKKPVIFDSNGESFNDQKLKKVAQLPSKAKNNNKEPHLLNQNVNITPNNKFENTNIIKETTNPPLKSNQEIMAKSVKDIKKMIGVINALGSDFEGPMIDKIAQNNIVRSEDEIINERDVIKEVEIIDSKDMLNSKDKLINPVEVKPTVIERKDSLDDIFGTDDKNTEIVRKNTESPIKKKLDKPEMNESVGLKSDNKNQQDDDFDFLD